MIPKLHSRALAALMLAVGLPLVSSAQVPLANGDFEDTSGTFPTGWVGTATQETTNPLEGSVSASAVAIEQDFAATDADGLYNFQLDFMVKLDSVTALNQRVRIRDDAGSSYDIITLRFGSGGIDRYSGGWAQALAYTITAGTTYHVRIIGSDLDVAGRSYTVGISSDGSSYTTSEPLTAFHSAPVGSNFEIIRFESSTGGATWDAVAVIDTTEGVDPRFAVDPASPAPNYVFSSSNVGVPVSRTVRFINNGPTQPITIDAVTLNNDGGGVFSIGTVSPAVGSTLAVTNTIEVEVIAASAASGDFSGEILIDTSADGQDTTLPLEASFHLPDKVVNISGVYPHLAMTNDHSEVGPGAIVPWAGDLWVVTYGPHLPSGDSSNKLYQIDPDLVRTTRSESVGGTPANRLIHDESNQLFIGHHVIAADGTVRTIPVASMPGRLTGTARHLTDPTGKVYYATMEEGFYEVDVNSLAVTTLFVDTNFSGTPKANLPGVHGKGLYSAQGKLYYSNNGNGGTLSAWDGATWTTIQTDNFTEITGPGGIHGNPPGDDRLWAVGWDERSLILKLLDTGVWHDFRLPKSSYTHDADAGWYTEWPRIRQLDPSDPDSPYLMHMHGMFFDFPATFSAADFSGLAPLCSYHKMPVDYCTFGGRLVMAKNDTSKFSNTLAPRAQSNLWFGQLADLADWGAPQGHGGLWVNDAVANGETSDPFLVNGFSRITLHLRNNGGTSVPVEIETSSGNGSWTSMQSVNVPANGATFAVLNDLGTEWLRLRANASSSDLTAYLLLSNPYPHASPASLGTDDFAALADIRDTSSYSDGVIRVMSGSDLKLEFASSRADSGGGTSTHRYHQIGGPMELDDLSNAPAEAALRTEAATPHDYGADSASAFIDDGGTRYRLPMLDALYDAPFAAGWARGFREVVTERELLNCHGTFYEIPRDNSGGIRRMRPLATHGKRITDFATWRGLLVLTGVLDDAPVTDSLVKTADGTAALWLGEVDDIWRMGEPRGTGGPWKNTSVTAGAPSDPYLMYGYDHKELQLSHGDAGSVTFTVEIDFLGDNTWSTYGTFSVEPGETLTHTFPTGFHAHWVRVTSETSTTATAQFTYGPADQRDVLLDWSRDEDLPTGAGRTAVAMANGDGDELPDLAEFVFGTDPHTRNPWPLATDATAMTATLRDLAPEDGISVTFESCTDLESWTPRPDLVTPDPDQSGVPSGFTRMLFHFPPADTRHFVRIAISMP
jgi:hypothetical protein